MNDPRRSEWSDPTQQASPGYPTNQDPAYAVPYPDPYGPTSYGTPSYYGQGYGTPAANPTEPLPPYWQQGGGYPPAEPPEPPPGPPKSPRWLWIVAAAAVLLVVGLVIALVIVSGSSKESTVVAPLPSLSETTTAPRPTTPTRIPSPTTTRTPLPTTTPTPTTPIVPGETTAPGSTDTVVYSVSGDGRAINITYVDTGGVMQTEFNVLLPWSREVSLDAPARSSASVAIVNVGRDVTCSVSVNGVQVRQRTGRGLTICTAAG